MTVMESLALTNYGHFTTMLVEDGRVRGLRLHLDRLVADCATMFAAELPTGLVRQRIREAIADRTGPVVARVTITDPGLSLARPSGPAQPQVLVTIRPHAPTGPPLRVRSTVYTRDVPGVKHTGLLGPLYERRRAQLDGWDDALFTDADASISEGVTWNIGFLDGDTLIWPEADALPGVTARLLAGAYDGPQRTEPVGLSRLPGLTAAFATNAATGVRPIAAADATRFDIAHPALEALRRRYESIVPEEI
ncbi:aminotransferase class IV [Actinoplanes couchii]|uniref:Aminotransferase class IV n=1 Tax=Actinoplanes couchii TaxID=403638 RepID=A0ABQ3XEK2_9ACTN|nr:branched-subunit amino acid aminotransferase/4-amino-4-deoxychorismate lyase [Actinoplanes couchii]GID56850.1 hypothetical protein Aco03nite_052540 [Actinoplanes couchii]